MKYWITTPKVSTEFIAQCDKVRGFSLFYTDSEKLVMNAMKTKVLKRFTAKCAEMYVDAKEIVFIALILNFQSSSILAAFAHTIHYIGGLPTFQLGTPLQA